MGLAANGIHKAGGASQLDNGQIILCFSTDRLFLFPEPMNSCLPSECTVALEPLYLYAIHLGGSRTLVSPGSPSIISCVIAAFGRDAIVYMIGRPGISHGRG